MVAVAEPPAPPASGFAAYLAALMRRRRLSGRQVASYAGVSPNTVNLWLRGAEPRRESLRKLARGLGLPQVEVLRAAGLLDDGEPAGPGGSRAVAIVVPLEDETDIRWFATLPPRLRRFLREVAGDVRAVLLEESPPAAGARQQETDGERHRRQLECG
jgi:transcriptional regulator with XRE-family HTH domain